MATTYKIITKHGWQKMSATSDADAILEAQAHMKRQYSAEVKRIEKVSQETLWTPPKL